jgi:hypothetical protein
MKAEWVRANLLYLSKNRFDTISKDFFVFYPIFSYDFRSYSISTDLGNDKFNRRFADFYFEYEAQS